jgi:hypothetical protein
VRKIVSLPIIALLLVGCASHQVTPLVVEGEQDCAVACQNMRDAKCKEGDPTPRKRKPCESWCESYHDPSTGNEPWAACVADAGPDPERIEACDMTCTREGDIDD